MADASIISVLLRAKDETARTFKNVEENAGKMAASFEKHRRTIGVAMTAMGAGITAVGFSSLKAAADVEEMQNKFNVVFRDLGKGVEDWAKTTGDATGVSRFKMMEFAATLQDTFVPMGVAREESAKMSKQLVELGVDLGSFNNIPTADVMRDLTSAMVGNTEGLLKYGVVAQMAQVKTKALEMGLIAEGQELDASSKAQAILAITMANTTDAQGDAARSIDSYTGRMRQMNKGINEAQVSIGQALLPVMTELLTALLPIIEGMSNWMAENQTATKIIGIVASAVGALMLVLGPLLLILPQLFAGMKLFAAGIRLVTLAMAANPVGAIVAVLTTLALVALPLVIKNWDSIWDKILNITEKVANFIIGILNKLTIVWRKQFELIATIVGKLLDMGSKLPFVGDKFKGAADAIRGFSDRLEDGIPQIDITSGKQEELQDIVHETEMTYEQSAATIQIQNAIVADSYAQMASDVASTNESMVTSVNTMADGTGEALNRVSAEYEQHVKDRISSADLIKEIQASQHRAEFEAEQARLQQVKDDFAERVRLSDELETKRDEANASLIRGLSEVNQKWKESGANVEEVMKLWSQSTDESFEEIGLKLDLFNTDLSDAESVIDAFAKGTGRSFFDMKDDIALALEEASKTVEEKMSSRGRVMQGSSFTNAAGQSLGLGEGGMKGFQAMSADQQVQAIQGEAGKMLSGQNLVDLTRAGDPAVSGAAIDLIQGRWENDERRLANEKILLEGGYGEVGESARTLARNSINAHLRLLAKNPRYSHLNQLTRDMGTFNYENSFGQANAIDIARQLAPQKYGKERDILSMYASGQITAFASGGVVTRPTLGLVGEAGPEAIVPLGKGGGVGTNNFHFHGAVYGVEDLKEAVVEAVRDHAISGGFSGVFAEA